MQPVISSSTHHREWGSSIGRPYLTKGGLQLLRYLLKMCCLEMRRFSASPRDFSRSGRGWE